MIPKLVSEYIHVFCFISTYTSVSSGVQDSGAVDRDADGESEEGAAPRPQRVKRRSVKVFGPESVV